MSNDKIYVTKPTLAPLDDFRARLESAWASGVLTHNGPLVRQFEEEVKASLGVANVVATTNGTIALQMAIKALGIRGEIITSPFTWIATVSAIKWEGCEPVFADIDPGTLNIDPANIESRITERTVAIMPVHVFGNVCDLEAIEAIAARHNLKVIYDAAHAVGVKYRGTSVLDYGDISATSFHATKMLNTAEGGACCTRDPELHEKLKRIRFFGHNESADIVEDGFNGKMTEVHAALGLANLPLLDSALRDRDLKYKQYRERLAAKSALGFQEIRYACNFSYFPLIFPDEDTMLAVNAKLGEADIFPRRYFYPSVNTYTKILAYDPMPISEDIARRILCLPLYFDLPVQTIDRICDIILANLQGAAD